jgi:hypothetical protein
VLRDLRTREVWREIFPLAFASWYSYDFIIDRCLETILYSSIGHTTFAARPGTATGRELQLNDKQTDVIIAKIEE